jgi:hypothetical protein
LKVEFRYPTTCSVPSHIDHRIAQIVKRAAEQLDAPRKVTIEYLHSSPEHIKSGDYIVASAHLEKSKIYLNLAAMDLATELICHEMVHLEQAHQGWLAADQVDQQMVWFGKRFDPSSVSYQEYREFPWERDAWRRGPQIARKVRKWLKDSGEISDVNFAKRLLH